MLVADYYQFKLFDLGIPVWHFQLVKNKTAFLLSFLLLTSIGVHADVSLVTNGKPVAEIVVAEDASPSVRIAAVELQKHLEAMSGAKLPIVHRPTKEVTNQVFVGKGVVPKELGFSLGGVKADGFRIVAEDNHLILAGNEFYNFAGSFLEFLDVPRSERQAHWEKLIGKKWRFPPMIDYRDYSAKLEFHSFDGTGTLYAVYDFLEQLGMRWYAPIPELGIVTPELKDIKAKSQSLTKNPEFPVRYFVDTRVGTSTLDEFLWYKSMRVGGDRFVPIYHSVSGPTKLYPEEQPQDYYGKVGGKTVFSVPNLSSEELRKDMVTYLQKVETHFPGIDYISIGQPDGWTFMDDDDVAAGWDKLEARGKMGRYSDYAWDFNLDVANRLLKIFPDEKFTVFAYGQTSRIPSNLEKVPDNMVVGFTQTSAFWMLPESREELDRRKEWIAHMSSPDQLFIWEYYLQHAPPYNFPPVPVIFPELMKESFDGLYDHSLGFIAEIAWTSGKAPLPEGAPVMARPWISHIMLYLHNKLCWDRNLDIRATLDEYYTLFYGPAKQEMKEFFEFAESVWMRPLPRQVTAAGGFLKQEDVDRYFDILERAKEKAGNTAYGKRIDGIREEMSSLSLLFEKLKRNGPNLQIMTSRSEPLIDGDLDKPFWREQDPNRYGFHVLSDMMTGEKPEHVETRVSFRWLDDNSALIVGIECMEPKMDRLRETCTTPDSTSIFADDMVEIRLETASGIRPLIGVNSAGVVFDECATERLEDLPGFYKVSKVAVKKYPDRWTVEVQIDAKPISGERPTKFYPWGVNINRQRMAGNETEHYMLSPSGTNFLEPTSMGNIYVGW